MFLNNNILMLEHYFCIFILNSITRYISLTAGSFEWLVFGENLNITKKKLTKFF